MSIINKKIYAGLFGLVSAGILTVGVAQADTRGGVEGYVTDSSGEVWRNSSGECWHSSDWTPENATVVGCDGVELDAPIEVILGEGTGVVAGISITATSMFEFDKADISDDGKAAIDEYKSREIFSRLWKTQHPTSPCLLLRSPTVNA